MLILIEYLLQPAAAMVDPVRKSVISRNPGTPSSTPTPTYHPLTGSTLSALLTGSGEAYGDANRSSVLRSTPLASLFGDGDSGASSAQQQSPEYFYRYRTQKPSNPGRYLRSSVGDPWHYGADPDLWIRISDKWIRIRLLSSVTLRMQKMYFFIFFSYNLPAGTLSCLKNLIFC